MSALALSADPGRFELVKESARRGGQPASTLAKIFQRLTRRGLLVSRRGPGGGYALARPASEISLAQVVGAVQDIVPGGRHCLLQNGLCGDGDFCPIHRAIIRADQILIEGFASLTIEDLAKSARKS